MTAFQGKGHIAIDGYAFVLSMMPRTNRHVFGREEAPHFVSKVSSGDPNYRDSTFFPHFVQNNWLNGFDQEKWNDGGKYFRSGGVNPTEQEELMLQKKFSSLGQAETGVNVLTQLSWRSAASSAFGTGVDGVLIISANTTDAPIDSACTGTINSTTLTATNIAFAPNQIILIHQTQGTGAGTYQKNKILSYSAGTISLETALNAAYVTGAQVIVMKQYTSVTIDSGKTWTAKAWNGTVGGILGFIASTSTTVTGTLLATGKGFVGGAQTQGSPGTGYAGEGTTGASVQQNGANGSGGGGGTQTSGAAGGGGGGNGTAGGVGLQKSGTGGAGGGTSGNTALTSLTFGGGGGGGSRDTQASGAGGAGGGIVYIFSKSVTISGAITTAGVAGGSAPGANDTGGGGGGGGAGGSVLIKSQISTLGTTLVTASGGVGGTGTSLDGQTKDGGTGGVGRVHIDYATSFTGTTNPTLDSAVDSSLTDTPTSSSITHMLGTSNGKIFSSDGLGSYTELFDARRIKWFENGTDADATFGDVGGTEYAEAQSFKIDTTENIKAVELFLKKNAGTPGNITVRIETDSGTKPSGTLVNIAAEKTFTAFTDTAYGWKTIEFSSEFALTGATLYWIVVKIAAGANDNNYVWAVDGSSPGYTDGSVSRSADGGSTWTTDAAKDAYFRILSHATSVNKALVSTISGATIAYFACGSPASTTNGDAKLITYNGTTWAIAKVFNGGSEVAALSFAEYGATPKLYVGLGGQAKVYVTTDGVTFTLAKKFTLPDNPGYVFALQEYGGRLYAGGGYPELLYGPNYQYGGFVYSFDEYSWTYIPQFEYTVVTTMKVYDNLLFLGTIHKHLYVYNTASMDKLFEFPWDVQISDMVKWDDKLAIAVTTTPGKSSEGEEGVYLFDRNGFHKAFFIANRSFYSLFVLSNNLVAGGDEGYAYVTNANTYQATSYMQQSYYEASLPSIDKLWRSVILHYKTLPTGCSILVEYKTDESDAAWTTLGTASTVGSITASFTFADTFYSKKLSLRLTLATSVAASTPTLKVIDVRYLITPDFKYLWKFKVTCPDNIIWLDGTEPISTTVAATLITDTTLDLVDGTGFPTKGRAVVVDGSVENEFAWTGRTVNQLTGVTGLFAHTATGLTVKMTGATMHKTLLLLKQGKEFYTYTDIDGLTYNVMFNQFQADDFIVNQESGIENDVPVALLEA